MSYILEALRRAERERNPAQAETPRVESRTRFSQIPDLHQLRQYRPVAVACLCAGLMIAVTILLIRRPHANTAEITAATQTATQAAVAMAAPAPDPYASLLKQVYGDGNGPATLDDLVDAGSEPAPDELPVDNDIDNAATTARRLSEAAVPASDDTSAAAASPSAAPLSSPAPAPVVAAAVAARPAPVTSVERVQLDPAPPPQAPRLSDMPSDYRAAFPAISLDVHSYDSTPKKRFIMISGRRYNEGDTLPDGPRVVQIVADGVIFDFRGEQVLFGITR
ncbi:MAG: hypothetical protein E6Q40_11360 [Cupriavidus sp.]|nr:MAG: hypothetical protein E6Q40_11360 [Cupriavidus sp.]